jgi:hypothetical protein
MCIDIVSNDTFPQSVHLTQIVLGIGIPLFGSKGDPLSCGLNVLRYTLPLAVLAQICNGQFGWRRPNPHLTGSHLNDNKNGAAPGGVALRS